MKTVTLGLAKQLKEVGFPQETGFYFYPYLVQVADNEVVGYEVDFGKKQLAITFSQPFYKDYKHIAAPTAEELLEQFPLFMDTNDIGGRGRLIVEKGVDGWTVGYVNDGGRFNRSAGTIAEAAAKMWLYLKENGLLKSS